MAAFGYSEEDMSTGSSTDHDLSASHGSKTMGELLRHPPTSSPVRSPLNWSYSSDLEVSEINSLPSTPNSSMTSASTAKDKKAVLKYAHFTNEYIRLSELLEDINPEQLKENLQRRLVKNDTKAIVAMSILFPRTHFPFVQNSHCVRCHDNYNPRDNSQPCRVPHPVDLVISVGSDPQGVINYYCKGCRQGFKLFRRTYDLDCDFSQTGVCFHGKHTSNPRDVAYKGAVRTCEDRGCAEFYV